MPDASALLSHILAQTRSNVEFLISQNAISRPDGSAILAKLPSSPDGISDQMRRMTIPDHPSNNNSNAIVAPVRNAPPAITHAHAPPPGPPQPQTQRAKALWAYNEHGSEPNDLSFRAGDIVEVLAETNADWWTGRVNGREGLFPSNYVEKIESAPSGPPPAPAYGANAASSYGGPPPPSSYAQQSTYSPPGQAPYPPPAAQSSYAGQSSYPGQSSYGGPEKNAYGAPAPYQSPPPPQQQYPPPQGYQVQQQPPPQQQQVVVQQEQKPSLKSKYGGLLATSAVGGAGFGAGSAIGSGLVNAIF